MSKTSPKRDAIQKQVSGPMKAILDETASTLKLDPADKDNMRRLFRAAVAVAAQQLIAANCPPDRIAAEAIRAVFEEYKSSAQGTALLGQVFDPVTTGKA